MKGTHCFTCHSVDWSQVGCTQSQILYFRKIQSLGRGPSWRWKLTNQKTCSLFISNLVVPVLSEIQCTGNVVDLHTETSICGVDCPEPPHRVPLSGRPRGWSWQHQERSVLCRLLPSSAPVVRGWAKGSPNKHFQDKIRYITHGTHGHKCNVTEDDIEVCEEDCVFRDPAPCDKDVFEMCSILLTENSLTFPGTVHEAFDLYLTLRQATQKFLIE